MIPMLHALNGANVERLEEFGRGFKVPSPALKRETPGLRFLTYDEMLAYPQPRWLIPGLLTEGSSALLSGRSNTFKSFLAIDIACSVATGHTWHGKAVQGAGPVLYIATEGGARVARQRIPGWMEAHQIPKDQRQNIFLYPQEIALDDEAAVKALLATCATMNAERRGSSEPASPKGAFGLVVIDIFGASMNGAETDHETARAWVRNINRIAREVGCAVLTVAHTGWSDDKRLRGHSHFWGSFDRRLLAQGDKKDLTTVLSVERHKDSDSKGFRGFQMQEVPVPGGEGATTLVPLLSDGALDTQRKRLSAKSAILLKALTQAMEAQGEVRSGPDHPQGRSITLEQWRQACPPKDLTDSDKPAALKKAFGRAKDELLEKGLVKQVGTFVWKEAADE